ncbi:MAG: aa3-type cytochrome c oxidase subunit IV [Pseudomonadota bacterium]
MADTADNHAGATHEIEQHEQTWDGFKTMMVWGTVGCALVGALVVFLIAQ